MGKTTITTNTLAFVLCGLAYPARQPTGKKPELITMQVRKAGKL
jgi:hypothetical protein